MNSSGMLQIHSPDQKQKDLRVNGDRLKSSFKLKNRLESHNSSLLFHIHNKQKALPIISKRLSQGLTDLTLDDDQRDEELIHIHKIKVETSKKKSFTRNNGKRERKNTSQSSTDNGMLKSVLHPEKVTTTGMGRRGHIRKSKFEHKTIRVGQEPTWSLK